MNLSDLTKILDGFRCLIFDFDGVLFETKMANAMAYQAALQEIGIKKSLDLLLEKAGLDFPSLMSALDIKISGVESTELKKRKAAIYLDYFPLVKKNELLFELIPIFLNRGTPCCIGTSASRKNVENILDYYQVSDLFGFIVSREDVVKPKPDPETFLKCCNHFSLAAKECLVLEDSASGLAAATSAGMKSIYVTTFLEENGQHETILRTFHPLLQLR